MQEGGGAGQRGIKGRKNWDPYNSIINKICIKKKEEKGNINCGLENDVDVNIHRIIPIIDSIDSLFMPVFAGRGMGCYFCRGEVPEEPCDVVNNLGNFSFLDRFLNS